jgi:5'-deoxynucleotidase YfbR-like HD superfamily hydrolase
MRKTLEFIVSGSEVTRYHTVTTLVRETVGHHSHGVAMMVLLINPRASGSLLRAALMHDLAEHQTGDIPSPAKREYGIGEQVNELEHRLMLEAGIEFPELSAEDLRTLKLADIAQGAMYCLREVSLGNKMMQRIFRRYSEYAEAMEPVGREREVFNAIYDLEWVYE